MDQETMKFMGELQEFVHKAQKFLQSSGGNFGQRTDYYGMRDNGSQGGQGYNQGGGNYGQREQPWMQNPGQGKGPNWGSQQSWPGMQGPQGFDPRLFL